MKCDSFALTQKLLDEPVWIVMVIQKPVADDHILKERPSEHRGLNGKTSSKQLANTIKGTAGAGHGCIDQRFVVVLPLISRLLSEGQQRLHRPNEALSTDSVLLFREIAGLIARVAFNKPILC
jgi:ABC-type cobalamin transport system permease subunit